MPLERDIAIVDDLRARTSETDWIEFKVSNDNPEMIGKLCSALSNAARISDQECAYVVWGIENSNHDVVGTTFEPDTKSVGNQLLQMWLAQNLQPSIAFQFRSVAHPGGNVVLLEIPAATTAPTAFRREAYIRIGSGTPRLSDYPDRFAQLNHKLIPYQWERGVAKRWVTSDEALALLDYRQYFRLTSQRMPESTDGIADMLAGDGIINADAGGRWNITNLGAILFAFDLSDFDHSLARKAVRFVAYAGSSRSDRVIHRQDGRKGYASGFEGLLEYINGLLPRNEHIGLALRVDEPLFPQLAVRELVANALIHQDLTITGTGPLIELFADRIEISNPGSPLMETSRMIDLPPRSRNEMIASLMRRMGICEEQGSGLDKVIAEVEVAQLPPPLLRGETNSMQVVLYGPRRFADMTAEERVRACYFHAVLRFLGGDRMRNSSLRERFGIESRNAAQASQVIGKTLEAGLIRFADPDHPRAGYVPSWA